MDIKSKFAKEVQEVEEIQEEEVASSGPIYKKGTYTGEYRILDTKATPIPRFGNEYKPANEDQIACLDYQVKQGRVIKH